MSILSGTRVHAPTARSIFTGVVVVSGVIWALLFAGVFGDHRGAVAGVLQVLAAGGAAVVLGMASVRPNPPLGSATAILAVGAALWCATDIAWWVVDELALTQPEWMNLGYAVPTLLYAAAAWSVARAGSPGPTVHYITRGLVFIDGVIIAAAVGVWWLFEVWEPMIDGTQATVTLVFTVADAAFLAGALSGWSRADSHRRPTASVLVLAAMVLLATDLAYARSFVDYSAGHVLDFGWCMVSATIAGAAFRPPWAGAMRRPAAHGLARSMQVLLAPALLIVVMGLTAAKHHAPSPAAHTLLHSGMWGLIALLLVRESVQLAEYFLVNRRLKAAADDLRHQADHDDLTGLLDRQSFHRRLDAALADRKADGGRLALLWVDIDSFKRVNELLGTDVGDRVLAAAADRMRLVSGQGDDIARYYSDTFVAVRPLADDDVEDWAERVRAALAARFEIDGVHVRVTCAIGLFDGDTDHDRAATLVSEASIAMTEVRQHGKNQVVRHRLDRSSVREDHRQLATDLRTAIDDKQLRVHYQPICDTWTGHVVGAEALLRFEHPTRGRVSPDEFLPIAVATGLMPELAMLVLNEACATFAEDPGLGWVTVNLTESDLADPRLVDRVRTILRNTGLEPDRLMVELSERVVPEADVIRGIDRLRELGIGLALDDFGSAWTSLAQVQRLAVRVVKVDRSIVERLDRPDGERYVALMRTVVSLARILDVVVLAEGIENEAQLEECRAAGAELGQGFLWAPALPATALARYITTSGPAILDPAHRDPLAPR